jgi:hypothetical protein
MSILAKSIMDRREYYYYFHIVMWTGSNLLGARSRQFSESLLGARVDRLLSSSRGAVSDRSRRTARARQPPQVSTTGPCTAVPCRARARPRPAITQPASRYRHFLVLFAPFPPTTTISPARTASARRRSRSFSRFPPVPVHFPLVRTPIAPSSRPPLPRAAGGWRLARIAGAWRAGHGRRRIRLLTGADVGIARAPGAPRARQPVGGVAWRLPSRDLP